MSISSWKERFYPVNANVPKTAHDACLHSYRKWIGLKYLNAYELVRVSKRIVDRSTDEDFPITDSSCALCHLYEWREGNCRRCPLYKANDNRRCDEYPKPSSLYYFWSSDGDPLPMIAALRKAMIANLKEFEIGYFEAMKFTEGLDKEELDFLSDEQLLQSLEDCVSFQARADVSFRLRQAGRDFWFTRNYHGCGFWDGDWVEGEKLTAIAHSYGEVNL